MIPITISLRKKSGSGLRRKYTSGGGDDAVRRVRGHWRLRGGHAQGAEEFKAIFDYCDEYFFNDLSGLCRSEKLTRVCSDEMIHYLERRKGIEDELFVSK